MARWLLGIMLAVGLCLTAGAFAQDNDQPADEPEPGEVAGKDLAGQVENWQGEVLLKKKGQTDFEIIAPIGEEKVLFHFGDTIKTSVGGSITLKLVDGTIIELGPNSEMVFEQVDETLVVGKLITGFADVTFGSENFKLACPTCEITGDEGRFTVDISDPLTVTIFCIDKGPFVRNDYGLVMELGDSQRIEVAFSEDTELFKVSVHEFNELDVKVHVEGKEPQFIEPGASFTVDSGGNIEIGERIEVPPPPPGEKVVLQIQLEVEKTKDEPYENAGDLEEIHIVSPVKP